MHGLGVRVTAGGRGQLRGLDGLAAAGGELVGAELAHGRLLDLCWCGVRLHEAVTLVNVRKVESVPLNSKWVS
ncbi:hypothetical protein GCM10023226_04080 [Nocardioides nanhaiensis]|uniref:Uncharacterized protein n=1 Tax=Nocardioides nanhaiensis TaxID=1476871 RepID=A0ABP8VSE2_9ACTN